MAKFAIGIPTYNGESSISKVIDSIYNVVNKSETEIELLVSDNCSTDATRTICEKYTERKDFVNFTYWTNEKNLGFDANVHKLVMQCNSEYMWICSDNEYLSDP